MHKTFAAARRGAKRLHQYIALHWRVKILSTHWRRSTRSAHAQYYLRHEAVCKPGREENPKQVYNKSGTDWTSIEYLGKRVQKSKFALERHLAVSLTLFKMKFAGKIILSIAASDFLPSLWIVWASFEMFLQKKFLSRISSGALILISF